MATDNKSKQIEINTTRLNKMETNMAEVNTKLEYLSEGQKELKAGQEKMTNKLDEFIDAIHKQREQDQKENDCKYASKKIENVFWWAASIIGGLLITAIMALILK